MGRNDDNIPDTFYNLVAEEISSNVLDQGLWLRCFSETNGNESATKALYIKYRVEKLFNQSKEEKSRKANTEKNKTYIVEGKILYNYKNIIWVAAIITAIIFFSIL